MPVRITPPLQAKGRYTVKPPYTVQETVIYTCIALRKFVDIEEKGVDVFKEYYQPVGLDQATYREDARAGAVIVTLVDPYGNYLYIPDTYITQYPNMGDIPYNHVVLAVSIGAIPDYVPLDNLKQGISELVSNMVGSENEVQEFVTPSRNQPTAEQHEAAEAARLAAITMRETTHALLLQEQQKTIALQQEVAVLTQIIIDAGIVS